MANNVYTYVKITNVSPSGGEFLEELFESEEENKVFKTIYEEFEETRDWMCDNVGAKWCYFEEPFYDPVEKTFTVCCISAWSMPEDFLTELYGRVLPISEHADMFCRYEDEMPNFVGVYGISHNGAEINEYVEADDYEEVIGCSCWDEEADDMNEEWYDSLETYFNECSKDFTVSIKRMEEE